MKAEFDAKDLAGQMTVTVHIKRGKEWSMRLRIAALLVRLACWIGWMHFGEVEFIEDDESETVAEWALGDPLGPKEGNK
jgi:hypothetical protein